MPLIPIAIFSQLVYIMKKVLLYIFGTACILIVWAAIVFTGTIGGWFHQPITKEHTSQYFREAVETELHKQFVGNFAMATLKEGIVGYEKFHSAGKPVDRNTVFQVSSLSKWISAK